MRVVHVRIDYTTTQREFQHISTTKKYFYHKKINTTTGWIITNTVHHISGSITKKLIALSGRISQIFYSQ